MKKLSFVKNWFLFLAGGSFLLFFLCYWIGTSSLISPMVIGVALSLCSVVFYFSIVYRCMELGGIKGYVKKQTKRSLLLAVFVLVAAAVFMGVYLSQEKYIYYWDYGGYWSRALEYKRSLLINPTETVAGLYDSINNSEYNYFVPSVTVLPLLLFGSGFLHYGMIILLFFGFPTVILLLLLIDAALEKLNWNAPPCWLLTALILLSPVLLRPITNGYCDAAALLTSAAGLLLVLHHDWKRFSPEHCVLLALTLVLTLLQRRYFAYFVVGFVMGFLLYLLVKLLHDRSQAKEWLISSAKALAMTGSVSLLILAGFFRPFLAQSFTGNFSVAYSAYSAGSVLKNVWNSIHYFGFGIIILFCVGIAIGLWKRNIRAESSLLVVLAIVSAVLFYRVQAMGEQHEYLLWMPVCIFSVLAVCSVWNLPWKAFAVTRTAAVLVPLVLGVNFLISFSVLPLPAFLSTAYSGRIAAPKVRSDIPQIQKMAEDLNQMAEDNDCAIYVAASSAVLNDDILRKSHLPDMEFALPRLYTSAHVDLRDGFPLPFFLSNLVVVGNPTQYHLKQEDQQVVGILAQLVQDSSSEVGKHYRLVGEYPLDGNVTAQIYYREALPDIEEIRYVEAQFAKAYPDHPEQFAQKIENALT